MSILRGFVTGVAKSLDERLQDDMRRTADRSERVREYHVTRGTRKQERFEEDQKELQETLFNLASFMDKSGVEIPEGMTKADFAAQLYSGAGGTLSSGKQLVEDLRVHIAKAGDIKGLINQANLVTQGKGFGDYINNFVRKPSTLIKVPKNLRGGVGFLKDVDITKGTQAEMDAMFAGDPQAEKFDVKGLSLDRSKMVDAKEYKLGLEKETIGLKQAKANLKKTLAENSMLGSIDITQVNKDFKTVITQGVQAAGVAVDTSSGVPVFDVKTGTEKFKDVQKVYKDALRNVVENAIDTKSLNVPGMKSTLKSLALSSQGYVMPIDPQKSGIKMSQYKIGQMYKTKSGIMLWTGNLNTSIKVRD